MRFLYFFRPWKMDSDTEAPKDPGVQDNQRYTELDYEGSGAVQLYSVEMIFYNFAFFP